MVLLVGAVAVVAVVVVGKLRKALKKQYRVAVVTCRCLRSSLLLLLMFWWC